MGNKVYDLAKKTKGEKGTRFWKYFKVSGVDWCCMAVVYWYKKAAPKLLPIKTSWCPTLQEYCAKHMTHVSMANAKPGDIVFFTWSGDGYNKAKKGVPRNHVGLIRKQSHSSAKVYTIEGNTGSANPRESRVNNMTRAACYVHSIYRPKTKKAAKKVTKKVTKKSDAPKKITQKFKVVERAGMMVRKGPSTSFKAIGTVGTGKVMTSTIKDGNWRYFPAVKGWVCEKRGKEVYLKKM